MNLIATFNSRMDAAIAGAKLRSCAIASSTSADDQASFRPSFTLIFVSLLFFFTSGIAASAASMQDNMKQAIESLKLGKESYKFIGLGISSKELEALSALPVKNTCSYNRFTRLHLMADELPRFLKEEMGSYDDKLNTLAINIVARVTKNVIKALEKETAWVTLRAFAPNDEFNLPRWHTDGAFFKPFHGSQVKFASVLKGSTRLFSRLPPREREKFLLLNTGSNTERFDLAELIKTSGAPIEQPSAGEGAFFLVGNSSSAAIHSEPPMNRPRIFFSVVAGSYEEIKELAERWHESL